MAKPNYKVFPDVAPDGIGDVLNAHNEYVVETYLPNVDHTAFTVIMVLSQNPGFSMAPQNPDTEGDIQSLIESIHQQQQANDSN